MGKRARQAYQRRLARQGPPAPQPRDLSALYGRKGGVDMGDEQYTFDMGEILWALGTGALTGDMAETAAAAWLANVTQGRDDPLSISRDVVATLGLDPATAYKVSETSIEAADVPKIAKELIDAGLLPPPPSTGGK